MQRVETNPKLRSHPSRSPIHSVQVEPRVTCGNFSKKKFLPRNNSGPSKLSVAGEGYHKLKTKFISHGLPETVVNDLIEHHTPVNYPKGSMIFLQGAPTDIIYWVSSGLVDILCPGPEGSQIQASLLGPGEIFGFVESSDVNGKRGQAFQARARTNVQLGLITRDRVCKVLSRLAPPLLVQLLGEIAAIWGSFTHYQARYLGMNFSERMEAVLRD